MPLFSKFLYINISVFSCHKAGIGSIRISISDSLQRLYHSIVYTLKSEETEDHLRDSLSHANREREELIDRLSYFQNKVKSQQEDIRSVLYPRGNNSLLFSSFFQCSLLYTLRLYSIIQTVKSFFSQVGERAFFVIQGKTIFTKTGKVEK